MGLKPEPSDEAQELGDVELLKFDMSQAAAYWNVWKPIQSRDRKSGVRKRTQIETESERISKAAMLI